MHQLAPLNEWKITTTKKWYIHDLFDVINNRTKCELSRMRTYNFQLKIKNSGTLMIYLTYSTIVQIFDVSPPVWNLRAVV